MSKATDCIKRIAEQTDKILLFHSATGKDSIVMLDLCAPFFKEIVCVYMWVVPNLACTTRYIKWAEATGAFISPTQPVHLCTLGAASLRSRVPNGSTSTK